MSTQTASNFWKSQTEYPFAFTRKRRMALPSILLLLAFVGGVFVLAGLTIALAVGPHRFDDNEQLGALVIAADVVARVAMPPAELPLGAVTALIGVPFFLTRLRTLR